MKMLFIDIESAPNLVHCWGLWKQNIAINQIINSGRTMCFAAKWRDKKKIDFKSEFHTSHEAMILDAWRLLDEADAVVHYNGARFDVPTLNKEFLKYQLGPPSPYKQIDLLQTARKQFRFSSNKLDHLVRELGLGEKVKHMGHELWVACMKGEEKSWNIMRRYNIHDVRLLEKLYERMLPWITNHPNMALYVDTTRPTCSNCGGERLQKRGTQATQTHLYKRYQCTDCGTWMRGRFNCSPEEMKVTVLKQA